MSTKHKSKYKAPKDLEKSQKPKPRKDLKDYTLDDKDEKLNPYSTSEKQSNVLRKTDKEVIDNGDLMLKYSDDDRLYAELEDGEYDPKHAAKVLKKRQDAEEKETADVLKDKIENLTREQKERLVREYIRRKIQKVLLEQTDPAADTPEDTPEATPAEDPTATDPAAATDPTATPEDPAAATDVPGADMSMPSATPSASPSPTPDATATPDTTTPTETPTEEPDAETQTALNIDKFVNTVKKMPGTIEKVKAIATVIKQSIDNLEYDDSKNFYQMLRTYAINKLERLGSKKDK